MSNGSYIQKEERKCPKVERVRTRRALVALVLFCAAVAMALFAACSAPDGMAAKVDQSNIAEQEVEDYITAYRTRMQVTDDAGFAQLLKDSGLDVEGFRKEVIDQIAVDKVINAEARRLDVAPSDDAVQQRIDALKDMLTFGDDGIWNDTIEMYGMSQDQIRARTFTRLAQRAVYEKAVPIPVPTDGQICDYIVEGKLETTIRHSYRIVFRGEDAKERSDGCWSRIQDAGQDLDTALFASLALTNSDDEDSQGSAGAYGWSDARDMAEDYRSVLEGLGEGECSGPVDIGEDGEIDIIYCDVVYEFPESESAARELDLSTLPDGLKEYLSDCAAEQLWERDCEAYLAGLLEEAQISYYPMPEGAPYNVDMSLADSSEEDAGSSAGAVGADESDASQRQTEQGKSGKAVD